MKMIKILENLKTITLREIGKAVQEIGYDICSGSETDNEIEGILLDTREINLDDYPNLKVISRNGVGLDNIDLEECKRRNIKVCITDCEELSYAVAEHALFLVLRLLKNRGEYLYGKTIGIIGYGRIGTEVKKVFFDMAFDFLRCDKFREKYYIKEKEKLIENSDIIIVCISGNDQVIGKKEIDQMKDGVYIVNVAREKCVNRREVLAAIFSEYKVKGYASDVDLYQNYENKSLNAIYTPHIASLPAKKVMEKQAVENLIRGLKNG